MDLVEARRKAREKKQGQENGPGPEREPVPMENAVPEKTAPKKTEKTRTQKKAVRTIKSTVSKKPAPKKAESKTQAAGKMASEIPASAQIPEKPKREEDIFVDMNFGEDLPAVPAAEKEVLLEEKQPESKAVSEPPAKGTIQDVKRVREQLVSQAEAGPVTVPSSSSGEPAAKPESKPVPSAAEQEKDFYELVIEDLVQYGYGLETEKDLVEFLSFRLGTEVYAVPLIRIQQIIKPRPVTLVPGAPEYIIGIISLRGTVIPIFDLRKRLGLPITEPTRSSRIIIIKLEDETVSGVLVDQVMEVARVPQASIEATPAVFSGIEGEFIDGIARHKNQMMIVLNPAQVILGRKETGKAE